MRIRLGYLNTRIYIYLVYTNIQLIWVNFVQYHLQHLGALILGISFVVNCLFIQRFIRPYLSALLPILIKWEIFFLSTTFSPYTFLYFVLHIYIRFFQRCFYECIAILSMYSVNLKCVNLNTAMHLINLTFWLSYIGMNLLHP